VWLPSELYVNVWESLGDPLVLLCEKKMASCDNADEAAIAAQAIMRIRIVTDLISCSSGAKIPDYQLAMFRT